MVINLQLYGILFLPSFMNTNLIKRDNGCNLNLKIKNFNFESCNHIFVINNQLYLVVKQCFKIEMTTKKRSKMTSCLKMAPPIIQSCSTISSFDDLLALDDIQFSFL